MRYGLMGYVLSLGVLGACAPQGAPTSIALQLDNPSRSGLTTPSIGDASFCYFVHVQGQGVGIDYEPNSTASCPVSQAPQGHGILSQMVGRYTAAGTDPTIDLSVPAGSNRYFHLLRIVKADLLTRTGGTTCFGDLKFGPITNNGTDVLFRPAGATTFVQMPRALDISVIGYAKADITAGVVNTVNLQPVINNDNNLGKPYGCENGGSNHSEARVHYTMRPKVSTNSVGLAMSDLENDIRIDLAPPRWREQSATSVAAAVDVPSDFFNYRVQLGSGPGSTTAFCAGDADVVPGRMGGLVTGLPRINQLLLNQTNGSVHADLEAGLYFELRVCAGYGDSYDSEYSQGTVYKIRMLDNCTDYMKDTTAGTGFTSLKAGLVGDSVGVKHVYCLSPEMTSTSDTAFVTQPSSDVAIVGVPDFDPAHTTTVLPNAFELNTGSRIENVHRKLPMLTANVVSTSAHSFFGVDSNSQLSLANLTFSLALASTSGQVMTFANYNGTSDYIDNVYLGMDLGCTNCSPGLPSIGYYQDGTTSEISNFSQNLISANINSTGNKVVLLKTYLSDYGVDNLQASEFNYWGPTTNPDDAIGIDVGASSIGELNGYRFMGMGASTGVRMYDVSGTNTISNFDGSEIYVNSGYAVHMKGTSFMVSVTASQFSTTADTSPAFFMEASGGNAPSISSFVASRFVTSGRGSHGLLMYGDGLIDYFNDNQFVRRKGPNVEAVALPSYAVVFADDAGTFARVGGPSIPDPISNIEMCSETYGNASTDINQMKWSGFTNTEGFASIANFTGGAYSGAADGLGAAATGAGSFPYLPIEQRGQVGGVPEICSWSK